MAWYSLLPPVLATAEDVIVRFFFLLGTLTIGPWVLAILSDFLLYIALVVPRVLILGVRGASSPASGGDWRRKKKVVRRVRRLRGTVERGAKPPGVAAVTPVTPAGSGKEDRPATAVDGTDGNDDGEEVIEEVDEEVDEEEAKLHTSTSASVSTTKAAHQHGHGHAAKQDQDQDQDTDEQEDTDPKDADHGRGQASEPGQGRLRRRQRRRERARTKSREIDLAQLAAAGVVGASNTGAGVSAKAAGDDKGEG